MRRERGKSPKHKSKDENFSAPLITKEIFEKDKIPALKQREFDKKFKVELSDDENAYHFIATNNNLYNFVHHYTLEATKEKLIAQGYNYDPSFENDDDFPYYPQIPDTSYYSNFPFFFLKQLNNKYEKNDQEFPVISEFTVFPLQINVQNSVDKNIILNKITLNMQKNNQELLDRINHEADKYPIVRDELVESTLLGFYLIQQQLLANLSNPPEIRSQNPQKESQTKPIPKDQSNPDN